MLLFIGMASAPPEWGVINLMGFLRHRQKSLNNGEMLKEAVIINRYLQCDGI
jgi:hypothetical protein